MVIVVTCKLRFHVKRLQMITLAAVSRLPEIVFEELDRCRITPFELQFCDDKLLFVFSHFWRHLVTLLIAITSSSFWLVRCVSSSCSYVLCRFVISTNFHLHRFLGRHLWRLKSVPSKETVRGNRTVHPHTRISQMIIARNAGPVSYRSRRCYRARPAIVLCNLHKRTRYGVFAL